MTKSRRDGPRRRASPRRSVQPDAKATATRGKRSWRVPGLLVALALSGLALAGVGVSLWSYWGHTDDGPRYRSVAIEPGAERDTIAELLHEADLVGSTRLMALYLATLGRSGNIEPGLHLLPRGAAPRVVSECLVRGSGCPDVEVTIVEGMDHVRVARRLEELGVCAASAFIEVVRRRDLLSRLGIRGADGEGYLFPATYRLRLNSKPERLFERFVAETRRRLRRIESKTGGAFEALSSGRGWGESEILTLASIVEKEAQVDDERAIIASVFFNRLDDEDFRPKKMLQSDPTAAYGCLVSGETIPSCREFRQRILPTMLRDPSNPYNTYRHAGLPPGPIASPGEASIVSVLKPAKTDYLFFVATGDGRHRFSSSLEQHEGPMHGVAP